MLSQTQKGNILSSTVLSFILEGILVNATKFVTELATIKSTYPITLF